MTDRPLDRPAVSLLLETTSPQSSRKGGIAMSMVPEKPIMSKQTYAAPMSYTGSARRISAWVKRVGNSPGTAIAAWTAAALAIVGVWALVTVWYAITLGLFGLFTFPYRLIRRGQRKQLHVQ